MAYKIQKIENQLVMTWAITQAAIEVEKGAVQAIKEAADSTDNAR